MISRRRGARPSPTNGSGIGSVSVSVTNPRSPSSTPPSTLFASSAPSTPSTPSGSDSKNSFYHRKSKQQRPSYALILGVGAILLIVRTVLVSQERSSASFSYRHVTEKALPRMIKIQNIPDYFNVTRLSSIPMEITHMVHRVNEYWNQGEVAKLRLPENMKTRPTCDYLSDWQLAYHPSCNSIHEVAFVDHTEIINNGAFRDVWKLFDFGGIPRVLKTLRYQPKRDFDLRNFDRHRRDAMAFEQLANSPYVVDIYGHCGNSAIFDYKSAGNLYDLFATEYDNGTVVSSKRPPTPHEILRISHQVAQSVADAHHLDALGRPTIAHTDLKPDQWLLDSNIKDSQYRLSDFNRARFVTWDMEKNEVCPFQVGKNVGKWRSPEEYNYQDETEKVDIWSLGNVLYFLMTGGSIPFEELDAKEAIQAVAQGEPPEYPEKYMRDPFYAPIIRAMELCFVVNPKQRASAQEVADVLKKATLKTSLRSNGATAREAADVEKVLVRASGGKFQGETQQLGFLNATVT